MREETYTAWEERQALVAAAEAAGERMLHDEIRMVRRKPVNTLVFDFPPPPPPPEPPTESQLRQKRIRELLAVGRSNWTTAHRDELIELVALAMV